jgi:hypothetical protein
VVLVVGGCRESRGGIPGFGMNYFSESGKNPMTKGNLIFIVVRGKFVCPFVWQMAECEEVV